MVCLRQGGGGLPAGGPRGTLHKIGSGTPTEMTEVGWFGAVGTWAEVAESFLVIAAHPPGKALQARAGEDGVDKT